MGIGMALPQQTHSDSCRRPDIHTHSHRILPGCPFTHPNPRLACQAPSLWESGCPEGGPEGPTAKARAEPAPVPLGLDDTQLNKAHTLGPIATPHTKAPSRHSLNTHRSRTAATPRARGEAHPRPAHSPAHSPPPAPPPRGPAPRRGLLPAALPGSESSGCRADETSATHEGVRYP